MVSFVSHLLLYYKQFSCILIVSLLLSAVILSLKNVGNLSWKGALGNFYVGSVSDNLHMSGPYCKQQQIENGRLIAFFFFFFFFSVHISWLGFLFFIYVCVIQGFSP